MAKDKESVESLLGRLQTLARAKPNPNDAHGMTYRVPADLAKPGAEMLAIPCEIVDAADRVVVALAEEIHREEEAHNKYLANNSTLVAAINSEKGKVSHRRPRRRRSGH